MNRMTYYFDEVVSMSLRIGVILPKHINEEILDEIRNKYNIGLIKFYNKYIQSQLEDDEQFFNFQNMVMIQIRVLEHMTYMLKT